MVDWPPALFAEWWAAHRRLRRTRSYGCWFGKRMKELREEKDEAPRGPVTWYGRLWWDQRARAYAVEMPRAPVDLIQADKSATGPPFRRQLATGYAGGQSVSGARRGQEPGVLETLCNF